MLRTLRKHWPEYLAEAIGLGLFMISAAGFGVLFFDPESPLSQHFNNSLSQRLLMGIAMGVTAILIVYSPWGQRSGAHLNPALTLTFRLLGKISSVDACCYIVSQTLGGLAGMLFIIGILEDRLKVPEVNYVVTIPGLAGPWIAFLTELLMSAGMMLLVLSISNSSYRRTTGLWAGVLIAVYIACLAPLSGMSMNPARSLASAVPAHIWTGFWIYCLAPTFGMLAAATLYVHVLGKTCAACPKLDHPPQGHCIFCQDRLTQSSVRNSRTTE